MNIYNFASSSLGNCYLVELNNKKILIECGISIKKIIAKLSEISLTLNDISLCVISHVHKDHSLAMNDLIKRGIKIVKDNYNGADLSIKSIPVNHGETLCNAYIIESNNEKLFFGTDFIGFKNVDDLREVINTKFDEVMIECNYIEELIEKAEKYSKLKRQKNTHMSLDGCIRFLNAMDLSKTQTIYLIHLSNQFSDELVMQARVEHDTGVKTLVCNQKGGFLNG